MTRNDLEMRKLYADLKKYAMRRFEEKHQHFVEELVRCSMIQMVKAEEIHDLRTYTAKRRWCAHVLDEEYIRLKNKIGVVF